MSQAKVDKYKEAKKNRKKQMKKKDTKLSAQRCGMYRCSSTDRNGRFFYI